MHIISQSMAFKLFDFNLKEGVYLKGEGRGGGFFFFGRCPVVTVEQNLYMLVVNIVRYNFFVISFAKHRRYLLLLLLSSYLAK